MPIAPTTMRRALLAGTIATQALPAGARAVTVRGHLPWEPNTGNPPQAAQPTGPGL